MSYQRQPIIGIMGPGKPDDIKLIHHAEDLGKRIAKRGWTLLTGGRNTGVMDAASKGAYSAGGTVIGILPGNDRTDMSEFVSIPIVTGMGSARNVINILSADIVIVCGMGLGTVSEATLAIKHGKPIIFTYISPGQLKFFKSLTSKNLLNSDEPDEIIRLVKNLL